MSALAVIGGTGLERPPSRYSVTPLVEDTPFGNVSLYKVVAADAQFLFLPRHGDSHTVAPHLVNYRANILALKQLGAERVMGTNAVGSLSVELSIGTIAVLDDFIDMTRGRPVTLCSQGSNEFTRVRHTDFSQPYCPQLRAALLESAGALSVPVMDRATYVCSEGPRFESPAEIRMFANMGGDVVGMTGLPEAVFAREAGLCYAGIAIVTNYGAGLTKEPVDHQAVVERMADRIASVQSIILKAAHLLPAERRCDCGGRRE